MRTYICTPFTVALSGAWTIFRGTRYTTLLPASINVPNLYGIVDGEWPSCVRTSDLVHNLDRWPPPLVAWLCTNRSGSSKTYCTVFIISRIASCTKSTCQLYCRWWVALLSHDQRYCTQSRGMGLPLFGLASGIVGFYNICRYSLRILSIKWTSFFTFYRLYTKDAILSSS
jgi:hypothetical protein